MKFKSALAHRMHNFALKIEKISQDALKTNDNAILEELALFQQDIEKNINAAYLLSVESNVRITEIKQRKQNG